MKIIAHRGGAGLGRQNAIKTIRKGLTAGADEIEVDVRVNRAGVPVLSHDRPIQQRADSLESAIIAINKRCPLIVEIKPGEPFEPIARVINQCLAKGWSATDFKLASFDQNILIQARKGLPDVQLIVLEKWSGVRAARRARRLNSRQIAMNQRWLWWGFIRSMSRSGYQLSAYTVNNPRQAANWRRHGLHAVITDYPDRFQL